MAEVHQEQAAETQRPRVWLAADYHFPSTYSCRIPMSSMNSAPVMPAPGPATVRLALIKAGDEDKTPEEELTQDLLAVIASFAGRLYGLRSRKQKQLLACAEHVLAKKD